MFSRELDVWNRCVGLVRRCQVLEIKSVCLTAPFSVPVDTGNVLGAANATVFGFCLISVTTWSVCRWRLHERMELREKMLEAQGIQKLKRAKKQLPEPDS
mmetsp:Transcript_71311/g.168103  ORF Transcript_71311/g.168103 Transcript_71311/m.168103 type:complete len:100 (-) Transcript_71311:70-369(-)